METKNNAVIYILLALALGCLVGCLANVTGFTGLINIFVAPIGSFYLRVIQFVALPMILTLMIVSIISFPDIKKIISLSIESIFANLASSLTVGVVACAVTLFFVSHGYLSIAWAKLSQIDVVELSDYMDSMFNIMDADISGLVMRESLLTVFLVSVLLGIVIAANRKKLDFFVKFFSSLDVVLMHELDMVMCFAPIGIFAITADAFASNDLAVLSSLFGLIAMGFIISVLSITLITFVVSRLAKKPFLFCFKALAPAVFFGFATATDTVCIPLSQDAAAELGCDKGTSSFVIPFTKMLTVSGGLMDTYCCAAFVLVASGKTLPISTWFYLIFLATGFSILVSSVPMGAVYILSTILPLLGFDLPASIICLLFAVDTILDMCGTALTASVDVFSSIVVDKFEKKRKKPQT